VGPAIGSERFNPPCFAFFESLFDVRDGKSPTFVAARCRRTLPRRPKGAAHAIFAPKSPWPRLDNFFIADVQTGFGTCVAFYLVQLGWSPSSVGMALTAGGLAGVLAQIPGGQRTHRRRRLEARRGCARIVLIAAAALIIALRPTFVAVMLAEILHGVTAGIITPAISAITLASSAAAPCRCAPAATFAMPPAATP
jgi:hypothetical protein